MCKLRIMGNQSVHVSEGYISCEGWGKDGCGHGGGEFAWAIFCFNKGWVSTGFLTNRLFIYPLYSFSFAATSGAPPTTILSLSSIQHAMPVWNCWGDMGTGWGYLGLRMIGTNSLSTMHYILIILAIFNQSHFINSGLKSQENQEAFTKSLWTNLKAAL